MAEVILDTETTPSTPGAGVAKLYFTSGAPVGAPSYVDQNANDFRLLPCFLTTLSADFTGTNVNTAQPIFNASALGTITLPTLTSWLMESYTHIHTTGTTSHTFGVLFGGTATLTSIGFSADTTNAATEVLGASQRIWSTVATTTVLTAATATATHHTTFINGIVRINGAGTFIPQYIWSAAPGVAGVTLANSWFKLTYIGSNTNVNIGPWT